MAVIKTFWDDPYLNELEAVVTGVHDNCIIVDKTIAFAFSGGQESDSGSIGGYKIISADKEDQQITYKLEGHKLSVGDNVLIKIDWEKRYKIMRLHFAAEIVLELIYQNFNKPEKIGAHISEDKARVDFFWEGNISQTFDFLDQEINKLVSENSSITSNFSDEENEIRYWQIDNFAKVACGGTHIKSTGEIGKLTLKRNNIGKGKERIEIYLK